MELEYRLKGSARKELGKILTEYTGMECVYNGVPTCSYTVGDFTITKGGTVLVPADWDKQDVDDLKVFLKRKGYVEYGEIELPTNADSNAEHNADGFSVTIPIDTMSDEAYKNLQNLLSAKGSLIQKALRAETIEVSRTDDGIVFDWIHHEITVKEAVAYTHLILTLCGMARTQKRIYPRQVDVDNEKYAFRCFLLRLGFIGDAYKDDRKELLKYLAGNSAFKEAKNSEYV